MEFIVGIIIVVFIFITTIASARKKLVQQPNSNRPQGTPQRSNASNEQSNPFDEFESILNSSNDDLINYIEEEEGYQPINQRQVKEEPILPEEAPHSIKQSNTDLPKKGNKGKPDFDLKKAIIYSEIMKRKY